MRVKTGKGDDRVSAKVEKNPNVRLEVPMNANLETGLQGITNLFDPNLAACELLTLVQGIAKAINDSLTDVALPTAPPLDVHFELGDGNDIADITIIDSSDIKTGLQANTQGQLVYGLNVDMTAAKLTIMGGAGNDELIAKGGRAFTLAQPLMSAVMDHVFSLNVQLPDSEVWLYGGAGDDVLVVDTTIPFASYGDTDVFVRGGIGFNRLHLSGKLNDEKDEDDRIKADGSKLTIEALAQITVLGDFTDSLSMDFTKKFEISTLNINA